MSPKKLSRATKPRPKPKKFTLPYAPPRVAAIQMNSTPDLRDNLTQARALLDEALKHDPNVVAFPENMLLLTNDSQLTRETAARMKKEVLPALQEWAAEEDIWMLCGSLPLPAAGGKVTNTSVFFSPEGDIHAQYDKIHLFDVDVPGDQKYLESKTVKAGTKPVIADTPWGKFGLSICYDLRFPELFRKFSEKECEAIFIPAAFTAVTGAAHWDILTRARAVENQCFVIAPGQTGSPYAGRECYGHTRIIDPWGRVIAERPAGVGVVWADLDYANLEKIRTDLPALKHRKLR